jgi:hypothetical protein
VGLRLLVEQGAHEKLNRVTRAKQDLDTTEEMIEHKRNAIESVKDWAALLEQDGFTSIS